MKNFYAGFNGPPLRTETNWIWPMKALLKTRKPVSAQSQWHGLLKGELRRDLKTKQSTSPCYYTNP